MKKLLSFFLVLTLGTTFAQPSPEEELLSLLPSYFGNLSAQINRLGYRAEAAQYPAIQAGILSDYFLTDSVPLPTWLPSSDSITPPSTTMGTFLYKLPTAYWQGFLYSMDTTAIQLHSVRVQDSLFTATVVLPVALRGIALPNRKAQRRGELLRISLEGRWQNDSIQELKIKSMAGTGEQLSPSPLTQKEVHAFEDQLLIAIRQFLSPASSDSLRHEAGAWLKKITDSDTLFWVRTDQVLVPVGIHSCTPPGSNGLPLTETITLEHYSLVHTTDFYKGANPVYIGLETRLNHIRPPLNDEQWQQATTQLVPVADEVANRQPYFWKLTNLQIHY